MSFRWRFYSNQLSSGRNCLPLNRRKPTDFAFFVLVSTFVGLQSCAPNQDYICQYQALDLNNPCVQCREILVHSNCSTPTINYRLDAQAQCGQATITCHPDARKSTSQLIMIVALPESGISGKSSFATLTNPTAGVAILKQICGMESEWIRESMDYQKLSQPLTLQMCSQRGELRLTAHQSTLRRSSVEQRRLIVDVTVYISPLYGS
ncbi:hypothetical protein M3Y96_01171000 [Aphelenchoides besseyi]|nr:hypothetical protein M3Y96_01171000 [Aphelenchoides besseyi]